MKSTIVDGGETVSVGDYVCFKHCIEQTGEIKAIRRNSLGQIELTLESTDDCGGLTRTMMYAEDCWVE